MPMKSLQIDLIKRLGVRGIYIVYNVHELTSASSSENEISQCKSIFTGQKTLLFTESF